MKKTSLLIAGVLLVGQLAFAQTKELLTARLDRERISLGETAILSLVLQGEAPSSVTPVIANPPGLEILYRGSKPTVTVQEGKVLLGTEFIYHLVPKGVGIHEIPPIRLSFNGREVQSNPLRLEAVEGRPAALRERTFSPGVLAAAPSAGTETSSPEAEPKAFIELEVSHERPFVREPFVVRHHVFCNVPFKFKEFKKAAGGAEFVQMEKLAAGGRTEEEMREAEGEQYIGKVVSETVWFSQEGGERLFEPGEIAILVKRRSKRLFDRSYQERPPAGEFFSSGEEKILTLPARTLSVRPLPEAQKPEEFKGAVGNFRLEASLDKQEVEVGESVSLKLLLKGSGNLEGVKELRVGKFPFASSYSSRSSEEIAREKGTVHVQKSFETILIPNEPGSQTLGEISFWYFNPRLAAYRKTSSAPLSLLVKERQAQAGATVAQDGSSQQEPTILGKDIYFIKTDLGIVRRHREPYYKNPLFIRLQLSPFLLLFLAGFLRSYQIYASRQELPRRQRRARKVSYNRLEEARRLLNQGDSQGYAREAEAALSGYFEDKLNRPMAGLPIEALETVIVQAGGPPELRQSLRRCLEGLNAIRFASSSLSSQEVLASYTLCLDLITDLDELDFKKLQET